MSNLKDMGRSPLILAALAKDAVPALDFVQVLPLDSQSGGHFDSIILTSNQGEHFVLKMPNGQAAGLALETELQAIKSLRSKERLHLPFNVTNLVGESRDKNGTRALLFSYIYGDPIDITRVAPTSPLLTSIGQAIAAIHTLPAAVVEDSGLPVFTPEQIVQRRLAELDRAGQSGQIPASLRNRWEQALEDVNLFRFQPTVVHGNLHGQNMLSLEAAVSGVLDWGSLSIGDPAADLTWILGAGSEEVGYTTLLAYQAARPNIDENLRQRVALYAELEHVTWLLQAQLRKDPQEIEQAIALLADLATDFEAGVLSDLKPTPIGGGFSAVLTSREPIYINDDFSYDTVGGAVAEVTDDTKPMPIVAATDDDQKPFWLEEPAEPASAEDQLFLAADLKPADLSNTGDVPAFLSDATAPIEIVAEPKPKTDGELF